MTFWSALVLGLVASAHCAGMCGGLQMAMQSSQVIRSKKQALVHLVLLNTGRVIAYVFAGVIFATIGYQLLAQLDLASKFYWLRFMTGLIIFAIGVNLLFSKRRLFQFLEVFGVAIWRPMSKLINHNSHDWHHSLFTGIIWGFLPCGLVYSVLFTSVFSNGPGHGALIMLGFGLGTMPALTLTGLLYKSFKDVVTSHYMQSAGGVFFMIGGLLIVTSPYWVNKDFLYGYPELLNVIFCVT